MTALYEIVPVGGPRDDGRPALLGAGEGRRASERQRIWLREDPLQAAQVEHEPADLDADRPARRRSRSFAAAPQDARFAAAVAGFAELLRGGKYSGSLSYDDVLRIAAASRGKDEFGYRSEFVQLVRAAKNARTLAKLDQYDASAVGAGPRTAPAATHRSLRPARDCRYSDADG